MNEDRTFEREARAWLELGPATAPRSVVEAALLAIDATPQQRALRLPWRGFRMTTQARLATAVIIGALTLGGGYLLLKGPRADIANPGPTPSPAPTATSSPGPTTTQVPSPFPTIDVNLDYADLKGWIVYQSEAPIDPVTGSRIGEIWLVKADGSGRHELAPGSPAGGKSTFDISPDGTTIVFTGGPKAQLYEVPIEGRQPKLLATDCGGCYASYPTYSPDGSRIAFVAYADGGPSVIGIIATATGATTILEASRVPPDNPGGGFTALSHPTWSADGAEIAYQAFTRFTPDPPGPERESTIRIVDVDGTGFREIPGPTGQFIKYPDWSPDGSLIVFASTPYYYGGPYEIRTVRPDGSDMTLVCPQCLGGGFAPSWTPDGKHILFWSDPSWGLVAPDGTGRAYINNAKLTFDFPPGSADVPSPGHAALLQPTP